MPDTPTSRWYETWFDSPHYHRLYGHRSTAEASAFIRTLHEHHGWSALRLLDLACGKGRHAAAAAALGHTVLGVDLSANSIAQAKQDHREQAGLMFAQANMLDLDLGEQFDGVLNLFTSFGYFDHSEDHLRVLTGIQKHLVPGGFLVLDFLNVRMSKAKLIPEETVVRDGVQYTLTRHFGDLGNGTSGFTKTIAFEEEGRRHHFTERVAGLDLPTLESLLTETGFALSSVYGDYALSTFDPETSPRLILFARTA